MDYKYYERKINDVIMKCPIEAGVEIITYNLLDSIIDSRELSLVDINRIWKSKDTRLTTDGGVPDIAVMSNDFLFGKDDVGNVYGFIEVKATNNYLNITEQIDGQKNGVNHYLYTNGLVWKYFEKGKEKWEVILAFLDKEECKVVSKSLIINIDSKRFEKLVENISNISWKK